ncbi:E3 ubiquitin-protein ligase MIB2-like isoform X1 [Dreissena polymorpha]|uniref:E3 ubiquitin-protein ligase MIB2-like isoform X1 n=1 Tax=Dreissena polymorpha TaxID=45954 RepID=UPI002265658F|nr:E3 ubiquitin-protein ligase MIB2-like isoform X1 [Dreissena polymorpha]XP_052213893.1 E3 ubiquitin-protein ligase MIB2-like isoform X1 [Dreissena polymorpha]XP_052213894.1 E3 ubiquitin-protein ligase MIB2-like isoform X1 [Dreissena polymorpha]
MDVGLRVVRGPDWKWGNQDNGEGHVGTIVEIGKPGSTTSPDKTVVVQWDSGSRTNYRVGYQGAYDLRIFDNAPIGIKHQNIICDGCKGSGIQGMRWKCTKCHDFDLCTLCYMADKHDPAHSFQRFDTASSKGVKVSKRRDSVKVESKGNFAQARVVRGPDWDWGNQDGGEGKIGKVTDIRGWDSESGRSVAAVQWSSGATNVYRVGHKGKVDLKFIQAAGGGFYYKDHLPILGKDYIGEVTEQLNPPGISHQFKVGDKVRVDLEVEILRMMQEGHGGWNPRMGDYVGKIGTVHRITERGDVRVQYEGCANRWTFHPGALTKVQTLSVGDTVKVIDNMARVKELQKGHGEWNDSMKATLGKNGRVLKVYADGDLRVAVKNQTWTFNPQCVTQIPLNELTALNNTMGHNEREDMQNSLANLLDQLADLHMTEMGPDRLCREAAQGHLDVVKEIISKYPDKVDIKSGNKTALQVACHQGHKEIVQLLLSAGANLEMKDDDGDTALHYSAFGNQADVMELLLQHKAEINALNNGECSTLHVAVNKQHIDCVRVLLRHRADINIQDAYGDTALHDAIGKENMDILDLLVNYQSIDFTLKNKRGFNVLHHAALKGNNYGTDRILQKCRQIVDMKKDDGFAPLHLAALNGHKDVTSTLLTVGQASIEIRNNRKQTPLLLAVSQGHTGIMELLVSRGADVNAEDEDGDTCLHLCLMKPSTATGGEPEETPILEHIRTQLHGPVAESTSAVIACYLTQKGAVLKKNNHAGKSPLDLITDPGVEEAIKQFSPANRRNEFPPLEQMCEICLEQPACVTFRPCNHTLVCQECCIKIKKCIDCKSTVTAKVDRDGREVFGSEVAPAAVGKSSDSTLERRLNEMEENILCSICMERKRNMAFMCGHTVCSKCGEELRVCHMCRKPITKKITLYS